MVKGVSTVIGNALIGTGAASGPWRRVTDRVDNPLWSVIWMRMPGVVWDNVLHRVKAKVAAPRMYSAHSKAPATWRASDV